MFRCFSPNFSKRPIRIALLTWADRRETTVQKSGEEWENRTSQSYEEEDRKMKNKTNVQLLVLLCRATVCFVWIEFHAYDRACVFFGCIYVKYWTSCRTHANACFRTGQVCRLREQFAIDRAWVSFTLYLRMEWNGLWLRHANNVYILHIDLMCSVPFRSITSKWAIFLLLICRCGRVIVAAIAATAVCFSLSEIVRDVPYCIESLVYDASADRSQSHAEHRS